MLKKYAYRRMLFFLLGKYECKNLGRVYVLADNNDVMIERDYAKALKAEFDTEIQSPLTTWSGSATPQRSMNHVTEAQLKGKYKSMG